MKKILAISVACIYLAITSGLVLQIHYCMGKETGSSVKLAGSDTHVCGTCGMQNAKNKCCHDEVKFVKLQDVHQQSGADYSIAPLPAIVQDFGLINAPLFPTADTIVACNNSPPDDDDGQLPLFILHGVFRI